MRDRRVQRLEEIATALNDLRWKIRNGENVSLDVVATQLEYWASELVFLKDDFAVWDGP